MLIDGTLKTIRLKWKELHLVLKPSEIDHICRRWLSRTMSKIKTTSKMAIKLTSGINLGRRGACTKLSNLDIVYKPCYSLETVTLRRQLKHTFRRNHNTWTINPPLTPPRPTKRLQRALRPYLKREKEIKIQNGLC